MNGDCHDVLSLVQKHPEGLSLEEVSFGSCTPRSQTLAYLSALRSLGLVESRREKVPGIRGPGLNTYYPTDRRIK